MSGERHPCDYCGTMLDEDDCVESDIPAVNGPTLHSATQCREYVYAILGKEMAELRDTLGKVAALYNGFVNGEPRPDWAADQVLAAIGAALGPPWQDERPGGLVSPTAKPEPIGLQGEVCAATTTLRYPTRSTRLGELPGSATKALRCRLPFQHAGHHETLLPDVTGEDAGKVHLWPREPDWDRSAHMACDWCGADDPTTQRTLHADQWLCCYKCGKPVGPPWSDKLIPVRPVCPVCAWENVKAAVGDCQGYIRPATIFVNYATDGLGDEPEKKK